VRQVNLVDFPLRTGLKARQHSESLLREFAIIASRGGDRADLPKRLCELATLHQERYSGQNPQADDDVDAAIARGEEYVDLVVSVAPTVREDTMSLAPVLIEAVEYCNSGDLLTLAPDAEIRAFWTWFLSQFVLQLNGQPPLPWRDFTWPDE
jgi:hypothetical protein